MADLLDHQFEVGDVVFGAGQPIEVETWTPASPSWRKQDKDRPRGNGVRPGRDRRGAATWAFDAFTNGIDGEEALAAVEQLAAVWPPEELIDTPGAMVPLRYRYGGRTRRVYGRPREFDAPPDTLYLQGLINVTMNFDQLDPLVYDDDENSVEVAYIPDAPAGGLRSPLRSPLRSTWVPDRPNSDKSIENGGTRATPLVIEFWGGGVNPYVQIGNLFRVQVMHTLAFDDRVIVDARPWAISSTLRGAAIAVSKDTRISELYLPGRTKATEPPTRHAVTLGTSDGSTSARATIRWRDARPTT